MGLERGSIEPRVSASNVLSMNYVISFRAYATPAAKGVVVCAYRVGCARPYNTCTVHSAFLYY